MSKLADAWYSCPVCGGESQYQGRLDDIPAFIRWSIELSAQHKACDRKAWLRQQKEMARRARLCLLRARAVLRKVA